VRSRYAFPLDDIEEFENHYGASFEISDDQIAEEKGRFVVRPTLDQFMTMSNILIGNDNNQTFLRRGTTEFSPFSVSIFVFNDAVWKLMSKKEESPDTMLPMTTIPRFYWDREAIGPNNPHGVRRDMHTSFQFTLEPDQALFIQGSGGDFCGILESSLASHKMEARPLFAPRIQGPVNFVPKYDFEEIALTIRTGDLKKELYPLPQKDIDYTFSEHPQVFYEHGMAITTNGSNVQLKIGKKRPQQLFGKTLVLIGKKWETGTKGQTIIEYHVWLSLFSHMLG